MKTVNDILTGISYLECKGNLANPIQQLELDSRKVKKNTLFVAIKGSISDGHLYIDKAIELGATTIICEELPQDLIDGICYLKVESSPKAMAMLANNFYDSPSEKMKVVAVTGTNGKTSIATMLFQLFQKLGFQCGLLSTVENKIGEKIIPSSHTTPHAIAIHSLMKEMVDAGCTYCFMEASSHAIHQDRTYGIDFDGAIFTNLSHDHLDYHNSFKEYLLAKKTLFDQLPSHAFALSNADDKNGKIMLQNTKARQYYYALNQHVAYTGRVIESDFNGTMMQLNQAEVHVKLIGGFNAYNVLAVYACADLLGFETTEILVALSQIEGAEGRFEYVLSPINKIVGVVDYAHTPDALKKVLETIIHINIKGNKLLTVVGCGGDRDTTKRPLMGAIAAKLSDVAILTSDNPRTEDPNAILDEMQSEFTTAEHKKTLVIENRKQAIKTAVLMAEAEDIILVAGKGHEDYQEINGVKHHFDDLEELEKAFQELNK